MLKTLAKSVREYKLASILCPIIMVGEAVTEILIPYFMTFVIQEATNLSEDASYIVNYSNIALYSSLMVICAIIALICGAVCARLAAYASAGFAHNLREDMYNNLQTYSFANIDKYSTASLITRITTDVANVQNAYQMCLRMLVRAPVLFISAIIMAWIIEPFMAGAYIVAAIILGIIVTVCMTKVAPHFRTMFRRYDDLNRVVQEDLTAIRVVKAYVREDVECEKMNNATQEVYKYSIKAERILAIMNPCVTLVMYTSIICLLVIGSNMYAGTFFVTGAVGPENMQALITYAMQILSGVMMVGMCLNFISLSQGSCERIVEVLNEKTTLPKAEEPIEEVKDGSIEFRNVNFSYSNKDENAVLTGVNLKINSGETVGIIGATGSSKTSLVSLIPRLYDVTSGEVLVGGVNVKNYSLDVLRNKVAMVLQKNVLFSGSVASNLRWGDENASDEEIIACAKQACAHEFIENLPGGYNYDLGQGGVNVSGGQKQRLCIARALLKKPNIIIFDDSTSAVDTKTDATIRANLKKYSPTVTKIIIAQRIASVVDADKIVVLDEGKISAVGTHEQLLKTSHIYQDVYYSQTSVDETQTSKKGGV